jgi:hydrogenase maturation factor
VTLSDGSLAPRYCREDHCITCSDEGVPMRVLEVDAVGGLARCRDPEGACSDVEVALVDPVGPGDALLVHAGVALARLESEEAMAP